MVISSVSVSNQDGSFLSRRGNQSDGAACTRIVPIAEKSAGLYLEKIAAQEGRG